MASLYNINRSVEAYDIRMIDPAEGQLKSLIDIPTIGGGETRCGISSGPYRETAFVA